MSDNKDNVININDRVSTNKKEVEEILKLKNKFEISRDIPYIDKNFVVIVHDREEEYALALLSKNDSVQGMIDTMVEVLEYDASKVPDWGREITMIKKYYDGTFFERYTVEFVKRFELDDDSFYEYYDNLVKSKGQIK